MSDSKFKRQIEDFVCENCGGKVDGNGYTNHCPYCLWSKHVDIFPGDRAGACGGLMEPTSAYQNGGEWSIIHRCKLCNKEQKNKVNQNDDFDLIIKISTENK